MYNKSEANIEQVFAWFRWILLIGVAGLYFLVEDRAFFTVDLDTFTYILTYGAIYSLVIQLGMYIFKRFQKMQSSLKWVSYLMDFILFFGLIGITGGVYSPLVFLTLVWLLHIANSFKTKGLLIAIILALVGYTTTGVILEQFNGDAVWTYVSTVSLMVITGLMIGLIVSRQVRNLYPENINYQEDALMDYITGLYNHRSFQNTLYKLIQGQKPISIVLIDIDDFKALNDQYGHTTGDRVLSILGKTFVFWVDKREGYCFRVSGDQFAIILFNTNKKTIKQHITRWNNYFNEHIQLLEELQGKQMTMSYGVVNLIESDNRDSLLKRAEECLQLAKQKGRGQAIFDGTFK
ncbi:GGDEF domain-containing protein [Alkalibacillus aidingensis]|uniref:GGDEF domain-containing protein n=1 Tax=Alkalibacillus aidingensis TaxID=2747607 RepID=UPI001660C992|nr:GGDEF domain-containing protein [Alkalibacillus aidingensis]